MCKDMKKLYTILLFFSFLTLSGCDFLRQVAGRPTGSEIEEKRQIVQLRRKAVSDSLERVRLEAKRIESERRDSIETVRLFEELDVRLSSVFTYGTPLEPLECRYNLIAGVFRTDKMASATFAKIEEAGFEPFFINFNDGIRALCVRSSDKLSDLYSDYVHGREITVIPANSWIYVVK